VQFGRINGDDGTQTPTASPGFLTSPRVSGDHFIREAVLLSFCDPLPPQCSRLEKLSLKQWQRLLRWLDFSGLALYFFGRLVELRREDLLPPSVFERLQQNLKENTGRTDGLVAESISIQQEFQCADLRYANLKGLSLWPSSVPKPELRSQFDLDFLVAEEEALAAQRLLECRGYRLYAMSGRSWEFKRNERPGVSLKDLYKDLQSWRVELHIEPKESQGHSPLDRLEWRALYGFNMPVLSPVDLFMGQALHACKHICGEFMRAAHLEEFRRHVIFRREDERFWNDLYQSASGNQRATLALGVVTQLVTCVMGEFAPGALTNWTVSRLPPSIHLWIQKYGRRIVLGSFPGSKLYLFLQRELEDAGIPARRPVRQSLLPSRLPPLVIRARPNEPPSIRVRRYCMQLDFIFQRLRFHLVEGTRYAWELHRWRRSLHRLAQK
jgi:hypothetical protein